VTVARVRLSALGGALAAMTLVASLAPAASASAPANGGMRPGPAQIVPRGFSVGPLSDVQSNNWAGYVDRAHTFSVVRATWKQPRVTCTAADSIAALWVGLDGYSSGTVEQDGTLAYCHNGSPTYYSWWEMYPHNSVQLMHASVNPGDKVTSSVVRRGTSYTLKVVDHTHPGNSFKRHTSCAVCQDSSAEWIIERPAGQGGLFPLARFDQVAFFGAKVGVGSVRGAISKYLHDSITMVNGGGDKLASVSPLKKGGRIFVATWHGMQ
jgi:hypothetical protein